MYYFPYQDSADVQYLIGSDEEELRKSSALFLIKLKEQRRISQVAIDDVVGGCISLFSHTVHRLQAGVRAKLAESGVDPSMVDGLESVFEDVTNPFKGLETCYLQEKYFRDTLGLVVSANYYNILIILYPIYSFCLGTKGNSYRRT